MHGAVPSESPDNLIPCQEAALPMSRQSRLTSTLASRDRDEGRTSPTLQRLAERYDAGADVARPRLGDEMAHRH